MAESVFSALDGSDEAIGVACGPRDAKPIENRDDEIESGFEGNTMPLGHVNWLHASSRTQHGADDFAVVAKRGPRSRIGRQRLVISYEQGFRAADGRYVQQDAEVRSEAKATRMGVAVGIAKKQVGRISQASKCFQERRHLPKTEQAGNVREANRTLAPDALDFAHVREGINHYACNGALPSPAKSQIRACYAANWREAVFQFHFRAEAELDPGRFARGHTPGMKALIVHFRRSYSAGCCLSRRTAGPRASRPSLNFDSLCRDQEIQTDPLPGGSVIAHIASGERAPAGIMGAQLKRVGE